MANYKDGMGNYKGGGGATVSKQELIKGTNFTSTSNAYVFVTDLRLTLPNNAGKSVVIATIDHSMATINIETAFAFFDNDVEQEGVTHTQEVAGKDDIITMMYVAENNGQNVEIRVKNDDNSSTITVYGATNRKSNIQSYEVV